MTLPDTIDFKDFKNCLACYLTATGVSFNQMTFLTQLYEKVIKPMADTQALFDSANYMTRLYTTMSADEMTTDPAFDFNKDLGNVTNLHSASIAVGCGAGPWTATMPQGGTVSGPTMGVWPIKLGDQPAAFKILEYGKQGPGKVVEDRSAMIEKLLKDNAKAGSAGSGGTGAGGTGSNLGKAGTGASSGGGAGMTGVMIGQVADAGDKDAGSAGASGSGASKSSGSGCAVASGRPSSALWLLLASVAVLFTRRRRRVA